MSNKKFYDVLAAMFVVVLLLPANLDAAKKKKANEEFEVPGLSKDELDEIYLQFENFGLPDELLEKLYFNYKESKVPVPPKLEEAYRQLEKSRLPYFGEDIVIAVPLPQMKSTQKTDEWIPQFMQDSLTTNLARYSKMTVIDRANESLALAEQKLSIGAQYDESTTIEIGKMTNAKFVLAGSVQMLSKNYSVNFRVNNIETNEIKASFQKNYTLAQIESGMAVQEISKEIMIGLGIKLDAAALAALGKTDDKAITVNQNLAKGAVAEKNEDFIAALSYFSQVQTTDPAKTEAKLAVENMLTVKVPTDSIKARLEFGKSQIAKWNKIFEDLEKYMLSDDVPIIVYDFSDVKSDIKYNYSNNSATVSFEIAPGVKLFPNRSALLVFKSVCDAWKKVVADKQNDWCREVRYLSSTKSMVYCILTTLYDSYGDAIFKDEVNNSVKFDLRLSAEDDVLAQHKYYNTVNFKKEFYQSITSDKVTDTVNIKITKVVLNYKEIHPRIFTVQEYEEWLAAGCP